MFRNYLKIAFRSLWKNKTSSAINISGLTIGLSCCLLIGLYIQHELSYDKFHKNGDRIVRVLMEYGSGATITKTHYTGNKVAPAFQRNFAEIEKAVRMEMRPRIIKNGETFFTEQRFFYADSTFFEIFSFRLLRGDARKVLEAKNTVVLSNSTAKKYFGNADPIGKTLKVGADGIDYTVTGIAEDARSNSQIRYDFIASFSSLGLEGETYWNANYSTFFLMKDLPSIASLQNKIPGFMKKEMEGEEGGGLPNFWLEPFTSIHLYSKYDGFEPNSSSTYVYIIAAVALLILAIACFTYINLSTARSMERAKEVGIRKVVGAFKKQIFWQFIGESIIVSVIALVLSIGVVALTMPYFNQLTDKSLNALALFNPFTIGLFIFVLCTISLLAGSYPAIILAAFQPIKVLKGSFKNTDSGLWVRKSLIVFQFVISVFLIVATIVIQSQLHYIQNKKLGYDREHVVVLPVDYKMLKNIETIKTEMRANPNILSVSRAVNTPTHIVGGYGMRRADMPDDQFLNIKANPVDEDYIKTSGLELVAGKGLSAQDIRDVNFEENEKRRYSYILNESAVKLLGWTAEEAVGKKIFLGNQRPGLIKGVVKDFHFESLHTAIEPLILFPDNFASVMMVKVSGNNMQQTITFMENKWKKLVPHRPFDYHFMDEDFNKLYASEMRTASILKIFAGTAILLACLGLFGLSSYAAQQRIKEIGIRKVLGASVSNIVSILSKDFIRLAAVASVIAVPVSWWAMSKWLQDFTYRIQLSWYVFLAAGLVAMLITLITVGFQAIRAALSNPVKSLRSE
jgi:putative ABC transport system permease protein